MPSIFLRHEYPAGVGLLIGAVVLSAVFSYRAACQLRANAAWVAHTHEVLASSEEVIARLTAAESNQRGYSITGDELFLGPYTEARDAIPAAFKTLLRLTQDNSVQQERLARFKALIDQRLKVLEKNIELRTSQGFDAARESIAAGEGRSAMAEIRTVSTQVI